MATKEVSDDELVASWAVVSRAVARTNERVLQCADVGGDSPAWFTVLQLLLHSPEHRLPMTHLARELSITTGGFTKLADRMGQEGLIDRRNSSDDRRVIYATLTDAGLERAQRSDSQYKAALREHVLDVLTPTRLAALADGAGVLSAADTLARELATARTAPQPPMTASPPDENRPERRRARR